MIAESGHARQQRQSRVNPTVIVDARIMTVQAGLTQNSTTALEAHYLAGGNVQRVILALIVAHSAHIERNWDTAAAIDLAGRDILEGVGCAALDAKSQGGIRGAGAAPLASCQVRLN